MGNDEKLSLFPFPVDRAAIIRRARTDAELGASIVACPFDVASHRAIYEHHYHARARELVGEIAECA